MINQKTKFYVNISDYFNINRLQVINLPFWDSVVGEPRQQFCALLPLLTVGLFMTSLPQKHFLPISCCQLNASAPQTNGNTSQTKYLHFVHIQLPQQRHVAVNSGHLNSAPPCFPPRLQVQPPSSCLCSSKMLSSVTLRAQIASIIDVLSKAAVAEIAKVVEDGMVVLRLEMVQRDNEIEKLKSSIDVLHSELRSAQERVTLHPQDRGRDGELWHRKTQKHTVDLLTRILRWMVLYSKCGTEGRTCTNFKWLSLKQGRIYWVGLHVDRPTQTDGGPNNINE